ncbi:MAG: hypothetical protein J5985_01815 [Kiritimatiellae bacterium]|nr:hypothetical protein [Kiritimatiellia bacterium]
MTNTRKILKWTAVSTGLVLTAAAAYIGFNSFDCEPPDLTPFTNPFEVPPEADNVYCGLIAVTNVVSEQTGLPILTSVFEKHHEAWTKFAASKQDMTDAEKDAILAESAKALALFHEVVQRKVWCAIDPASGKRLAFPKINEFLRLCRLVYLQARRHIERDEIGAAIEDVRDIILLTRKIENDSESVIRWLVAGGILNYAGNGVVQRIIKSGKATDEELGRLQDALRQFDIASRPERVQRMVNNEFTVFFTEMSNRRSGVPRLRIPFLSSYAYHQNRSWTTYARYLEKIKEGYRLGNDKAAWDKFEEEFNIAVENSSTWRFGPNFIGRRMLLESLPSWRSLGEAIARSDFQHHAVETIVAAARFKRKTGAFPKNLAELVPEFLPAVPRDPYAQGKELKYNAESGILWTVGKDGTFNGETVKPRANGYVSYGKYGKNHNYVFNIDGTPVK